MRRITSSRWLRVGFALIAVALLSYAIVDQWHQVAPRFGQLSGAGVVFSSLAVMVAMFAMLKTFQVTLAGLGSPLSLVQAGRIFFLGQLGKYVPGSVWPIVVQMELGADAGVPRSSTVLTLLFLYLLYTTSAGLVSAGCLPWVTDLVPIWLAALAVLVGIALLLPPVLNRIIAAGAEGASPAQPAAVRAPADPVLVRLGAGHVGRFRAAHPAAGSRSASAADPASAAALRRRLHPRLDLRLPVHPGPGRRRGPGAGLDRIAGRHHRPRRVRSRWRWCPG